MKAGRDFSEGKMFLRLNVVDHLRIVLAAIPFMSQAVILDCSYTFREIPCVKRKGFCCPCLRSRNNRAGVWAEPGLA